MKLKINEAIEQSGLKKGYIAEQLGISPVTFSRYISGERKIHLETAVKLAKILDCKVDDLYEIED